MCKGPREREIVVGKGSIPEVSSQRHDAAGWDMRSGGCSNTERGGEGREVKCPGRMRRRWRGEVVAISDKTGADADAGQVVRVSPMRDRPREPESA